MNTDGSSLTRHMLRMLEPAVRPIGPHGAGAASGPAAPGLFESQPFDALLEQAFRGEIRSERPVQPACDLQPPLNRSQLQRLADAADRAEASGAQRALMMLDGRGFVIDVAARAITSEMRPDDASTMLRVDAAMVVPAANRGSASARLRPPALHTSNATVSHLLHAIHSAPNRHDDRG